MSGLQRTMHILNQTGHTKIQWDADDANEVAQARREFASLRTAGYAAFERAEGGERGERVTEFNPEAQTYIMVPQLQGG